MDRCLGTVAISYSLKHFRCFWIPTTNIANNKYFKNLRFTCKYWRLMCKMIVVKIMGLLKITFRNIFESSQIILVSTFIFMLITANSEVIQHQQRNRSIKWTLCQHWGGVHIEELYKQKTNSISTLAMAKNKKSRSSWQFEKRLKRKKAFSSPPAYQEKKWIIDHDQIITSCNIRCENRLQCQCGSPFGRLRVQAEIQSALMVYILGDPLHDIYLELQIQGMSFNYKLLVKSVFETIGWAKQN